MSPGCCSSTRMSGQRLAGIRWATRVASCATSLTRQLAQTEVKIVDPVSGATVPPGTVGEICARGYLVMRGYFGNPDATAAAIDAGGWLHTGDLGTMDAGGYCRVEGRLKDMIIRGRGTSTPGRSKRCSSPIRRWATWRWWGS